MASAWPCHLFLLMSRKSINICSRTFQRQTQLGKLYRNANADHPNPCILLDGTSVASRWFACIQKVLRYGNTCAIKRVVRWLVKVASRATAFQQFSHIFSVYFFFSSSRFLLLLNENAMP